MKFLKMLLRRRQLKRDLDDELAFHLEMKAQALGGQPQAARREFGNPTIIQEVLRDMWTFPSIESWWRDVRYAVRSLASAPGFTLVAITALALGIGADTAMFTIVKGAFTWDMDLDHLDRTVVLMGKNADVRSSDVLYSYPDFRDFHARVKSLEGVAAYAYSPANVSDNMALPERFSIVQMSPNGFRLVGMKPLLGRDFLESDARPEATPVLMLSHRIWQSRYGADPNIVGKIVRVDEVPREVIGVMPPGRRFPEETDLWMPLLPSEKRNEHRLLAFGVLPPNGTIAQARAEAETISRALEAEYPATNKGFTFDVRPIIEITGVYGLRQIFAVLFAAVGFVLLIACADVANMLLARGAGRARELAIRVAIGAGRARIFRQLLVESVVLAAAGGVIGWLVALVGLKWFELGVAFADKPSWLHLTLDSSAFTYMAAVSIGAGVLAGLAPAWRLMSQAGVNSFLKDGGHGSVSGRSTTRLASALVVFQMVLCVVLLAAAGLLIRSANRLTSAPVGVETANILTANIRLPKSKYPEAAHRMAFHRTAQKQIESLPGVVSSTVASNAPLGGWWSFDVQMQSETAPRHLDAIVASPSYFQVFGLKPVAGQVFTTDGDEVVVNQAFAAKYWPNAPAIGQHLRLTKAEQWLTVVGVVPDVLQNVRDRLERHPLMYLPYSQSPNGQAFLLLRTQVPPATLATALRGEIQKIDRNLALGRTVSLASSLDSARQEVSIIGSICSVFAGIALVLATVGLYSVIAHSVNMRSQEIGLRMAMGGTPRDILQLVFAQGMRPLFIGLLIGVPLAFVAMRVLGGTLVGVTPTDPLTFASVIVVLLAAGVLGCVIPARRATRVDPVVALRCQ